MLVYTQYIKKWYHYASGQGGDVRKRRNVKEQESHPNQNDDDRITSSDTTSHSESALCKY
ncbi:hypothetical protein GBAR_LOCUS6078, partial [Geodia barretti]